MRRIMLLAFLLSVVPVQALYINIDSEDTVTIPCTACAGARCEGVRLCRHGVFHNEMCGNKLDCYQGPGEVCGETVRKVIGRCRPGLKCRCGLCVGHTLQQSFDSDCREFLAGRR